MLLSLLLSFAKISAMTLVLEAAEVPASRGEDGQVQEVRTGKERLGGKATDEQRVDNCKVPLDLRGPKPRPDECGGASAKPKE